MRRNIKSIAKDSQRTMGAHETQEPMGQGVRMPHHHISVRKKKNSH